MCSFSLTSPYCIEQATEPLITSFIIQSHPHTLEIVTETPIPILNFYVVYILQITTETPNPNLILDSSPPTLEIFPEVPIPILSIYIAYTHYK